MSRRSQNPVITYLQQHRWEWLPIDSVCNHTGCTEGDITAMAHSSAYRNSINLSGDECRYIGNPKNVIYQIVKVLKANYPKWMSGAEISKLTGLGISASYHIACMQSVLPIESERDFGKHHLQALKHRYVPFDKRAMPDYVYAKPKPKTREKCSSKVKMQIVGVLKNHPGKYFSSQELSEVLGYDLRAIGMQLYIIEKSNRNISRKMAHGTYGANLYAYNPAEASA